MLKLKSQLKKNHKHQMKELKDVTLIGSTEWKSEVGRSGQRHAIVDELREPWTRAGSVAEGHGAGQGGPQSAFPSLSP